MVSTRPPISKSSRPFNDLLVNVPKATITTVTFMFHSFFNSRARSRYFFSHSFSFILWSAGSVKSTIFQILSIIIINIINFIIIYLLIFSFTFVFLSSFTLSFFKEREGCNHMYSMHLWFFFSIFFVCFKECF